MLNRNELADSIYNSLVKEEAKSMALWKESILSIKLDNKKLPLLDVLTCVYNAESYVANAIESIINQSYPNIHLVIVTDPCTDNTIKIINEYVALYPNITHIANQEHQGIIKCFNIGLEYCKSEFIARMDLDDMMHPMRFEKQMQFLKSHPEIGVISCYMQIFNEKFEIRDVTYREDFDLQRITQLFFSPLSHAGSIFRAEVIKFFGYRDDYKYAEDYDLWFQIMEKFKTAVYPEFLYLYRTHSNQVTNEKNMAIFKVSWARIMTNIFTAMGLKFNEYDIAYHIDHVLLPGEFKHEKDWNKFHNWLVRILEANKKSRYFNQTKLRQFIYSNFWQTPFQSFSRQMEFNTFYKQLFSIVNNQNSFQKAKEIIKYLIHKK